MTTPTNPCPDVELNNICNGPTDEVLGYNCMALASSPCASGSNPFSESLEVDQEVPICPVIQVQNQSRFKVV